MDDQPNLMLTLPWKLHSAYSVACFRLGTPSAHGSRSARAQWYILVIFPFPRFCFLWQLSFSFEPRTKGAAVLTPDLTSTTSGPTKNLPDFEPELSLCPISDQGRY